MEVEISFLSFFFSDNKQWVPFFALRPTSTVPKHSHLTHVSHTSCSSVEQVSDSYAIEPHATSTEAESERDFPFVRKIVMGEKLAPSCPTGTILFLFRDS